METPVRLCGRQTLPLVEGHLDSIRLTGAACAPTLYHQMFAIIMRRRRRQLRRAAKEINFTPISAPPIRGATQPAKWKRPARPPSRLPLSVQPGGARLSRAPRLGPRQGLCLVRR